MLLAHIIGVQGCWKFLLRTPCGHLFYATDYLHIYVCDAIPLGSPCDESVRTLERWSPLCASGT
ncbi:unnamed protein product [Calypogeia fissa]